MTNQPLKLTSSQYSGPFPPPYRPNRKAKIGFVISLVAVGVMTVLEICSPFWTSSLSQALLVCEIVVCAFTILLGVVALVLCIGGLRRRPKVPAILGTVFGGVAIIQSLSLLGQAIANMYNLL